ncbi:hypothetical protein P3S67_016867 [Capsicum chacoense]
MFLCQFVYFFSNYELPDISCHIPQERDGRLKNLLKTSYLRPWSDIQDKDGNGADTHQEILKQILLIGGVSITWIFLGGRGSIARTASVVKRQRRKS